MHLKLKKTTSNNLLIHLKLKKTTSNYFNTLEMNEKKFK